MAKRFDRVSKLLPEKIEGTFDLPKVSVMVKAFGLDNVLNQIEFELVILASLMSVGGNLNQAQVTFISKQLVELFPNETIADFKICFQRGAMGQYGNIQRMDGITLRDWINKYLDEKYEKLEDKLMSEKDSLYEVAISPKALPVQDAQPYLDQWLKSVKEVDVRKIKPMTRAQIAEEGGIVPKRKEASSYQPNPEYALLRLKEIEWMKQMFHPITRERVENFLSFEEWLKIGR